MVILITGSDSGIGKHLAKRFLEEGNEVIITGKTTEHLQQTKMEFAEYKDKTLFVQVDVENENSIKEMYAKIKDKHDYLDVIINNAAYDKMSSIENYDYNDFEKIVKTNLLGKTFCIKNGIDLLKKSKYPSIINIASRLAKKPMLNSSAYCCSAAGIVMLTKCAALELEEYKIRVNTISPSLTLTPLAMKSYSKEEIKNTEKQNPRKRIGSMEDVYNTAKFLISKQADYINGENINVNGGILLK